ncbi:MAG: plasmid replication protein, CyRepA1 family [Cyanobacteria bacterium P01_G01_bin.4]
MTSTTSDRHLLEWIEGSRVNREIVELNVESLSGERAYSALLYGLPDKARRNDGRIRDTWLNRYRHLNNGGWWCSGINLLDFSDSDWGCFKPDRPRMGDKNKPLKYEHPPKVDTGVFALRVSRRIWEKIAKRYGVEMPTDSTVSFWQWVLNNPKIAIAITEGAKKAGALLTCGFVAIALPGIFNGYRTPKDENGNRIIDRQRYLIPELKRFAGPGRQFYICFDQDEKPKTIQNINLATATLGKLLEREKCSVKVVSWPRSPKGIKPIKAIDDLLVMKGTEAVEEAMAKARGLASWKSSRALRQRHLVLNQRYCQLEIPESARIVAVKAAKGTGKTHAIAETVQALIEKDHKILVLTHRIPLAEELANRFGIDHVSELRTSATQGMLGYVLCIDSLHKDSQAQFNPNHWEDAIIIVDETSQVLWHLLNSSTLAKKRSTILENLKELIDVAINYSDGRLILADADLSQREIDFFSKLAPGAETFTIENEWKPSEQLNATVYDSPENLIAALDTEISDGKKVLVTCGAQKAKSKHGTINLEKRYKEKYPDLKILRIDSESIADKEHPAYGCIANLDKVLPLYDMVVASPSIETGVSIDIKGHFNSVWTFANGVQSPNSVRQAMVRLRELVPRHIWISNNTGFSRIGNGSENPYVLLRGENRKIQATIGALAIADFNAGDRIFLELWAEYAADLNHQFARYEEIILEGLRSEGYAIRFASSISAAEEEDIKDEMKAIKAQSYTERCQEIVAAPNPTDEEFKKLQDQRAKTRSERARESKGALCRKYPGIVIDEETVRRDDDGWYSQIQTHYYFTVGRSHLSSRDMMIIQGMLLENGEKAWIPDINRRSQTLSVTTLETLEVGQFLEPDREFTSDSLEQWANQVKSFGRYLKDAIGLSVSENMKPIQIAQLLLGKLGLKLPLLYRRGKDEGYTRVYGSVVVSDNRDEVFNAWLKRDLLRQGEDHRDRALENAQQLTPLPSRPPLTNSITITTPGQKAPPMDSVPSIDQKALQAWVEYLSSSPSELSKARKIIISRYGDGGWQAIQSRLNALGGAA